MYETPQWRQQEHEQSAETYSIQVEAIKYSSSWSAPDEIIFIWCARLMHGFSQIESNFRLFNISNEIISEKHT